MYSHEAPEQGRGNVGWDVEESLIEKQSDGSAVVLEELCKPGLLRGTVGAALGQQEVHHLPHTLTALGRKVGSMAYITESWDNTVA